jgi:hypothetical protein
LNLEIAGKSSGDYENVRQLGVTSIYASPQHGGKQVVCGTSAKQNGKLTATAVILGICDLGKIW